MRTLSHLEIQAVSGGAAASSSNPPTLPVWYVVIGLFIRTLIGKPVPLF